MRWFRYITTASLIHSNVLFRSSKHLNYSEKVRLIRFQLFKTDIKDNCQLTNEQQARKSNKLYYLLLCLILLIFCHIAWTNAEYENVPNAEMSNINDSAHSWSDHKNACILYFNALVNVIKINVHCVQNTVHPRNWSFYATRLFHSFRGNYSNFSAR